MGYYDEISYVIMTKYLSINAISNRDGLIVLISHVALDFRYVRFYGVGHFSRGFEKVSRTRRDCGETSHSGKESRTCRGHAARRGLMKRVLMNNYQVVSRDTIEKRNVIVEM